MLMQYDLQKGYVAHSTNIIEVQWVGIQCCCSLVLDVLSQLVDVWDLMFSVEVDISIM